MSVNTLDPNLVGEIDLFQMTDEEDLKIASKMEEVRSAAFNGRDARDWQGILRKQSTGQTRSISTFNIPSGKHFNPTKVSRPVAIGTDGSFMPSHKEDSVIAEKLEMFQAIWGPGFNAKLLEHLENTAAGEGLEDLEPEERHIIQETATTLLQHSLDKTEMSPEEEIQKQLSETGEESILPVVLDTANTVLQVTQQGLNSPETLQKGLQAFPLSSLQSIAQKIGLSAAIGGGLAIAATTAGAVGCAAAGVHGVVKGVGVRQFREELLTAIKSKDPNNGVLQFLEANVDKHVALQKVPKELTSWEGLKEHVKIEIVPDFICATGEISPKNQKFREMTNPILLKRTVDLLKKKGFDQPKVHEEIRTLVKDIEKEVTVHMAHEGIKVGFAVGGGVALATSAATLGIFPAAMAILTGIYMIRNRGGLNNGTGNADRDIAHLVRFLFKTDAKVEKLLKNMALPKTND